MDRNMETLARCKALSAAAMARAADVAGPAAPATSDVEQLRAFTPIARAKILAVLDKLPAGKVVVATKLLCGRGDERGEKQ